MDVGAASGAAQARNTPNAAGSEPPPQPRLSAVEHGDLAAGRIRVAEGQVFAGTSDSAPATRDWGNQPPGSGYREAFDSAGFDRTRILAYSAKYALHSRNETTY